MPVCNIKDFETHGGCGQRLMGLDLGDKTIGVAISDTTWSIATPVTVIRRSNHKADMESILNLVTQHHVLGIIVGLPVNMDGSFGSQAQKMRDFAHALSTCPEIWVALWDERLSTLAVNRTLLEADMSRKRRREVVDKLAATYILQGALDRLRTLKNLSDQ